MTDKRLASARINWSQSDVCISFFCTCGIEGHYDGDYFIGYECSCGKKYRMGSVLQVEGILEDNQEFNEVFFKKSIPDL